MRVPAFAYLTVAAVWVGSMTYSLMVVQPRVARFFPDEQRREEFLQTLAHGNRWRVAGLIAAIVACGLGVIVTGPPRAMVAGFTIAVVLDATAGLIFYNVSWRHWPARVFALPEELASFRGRLRGQAWAMLLLAGTGYLTALVVSLRP